MMIKVENVTKYFEDNCAVNSVSFEIPEGELFGLLGTNGAGKSTLLKMMAGILESDEGMICFDGEPVYENPACKEKLFYLPDAPYYFPNASLEEMIHFYKKNYPAMERNSVVYMAEQLNLDVGIPLRTFSKGMKRQAFLILALCSGTKYLLCDEVFDGLDPVVTEAMKNLFRKEMEERSFTVIVASHKLKDLEDICHHIGMMHKGGIMKAGDMRKRAGDIMKFQCVFREGEEMEGRDFPGEGEELLKNERDGYFSTLVVRGKKEDILKKLKEKQPLFFGEVPLTLEETFILEMEEAGYDIRKVLQQMD